MSKKDPQPPDYDPDVTITGPVVPADPDRTVTAKMRAALEAMDPEDTIKPMPREPDPDATFSGPLAQFDPDQTIGSSGSVRRRANPFAPKALPEALQANLAALGGLNPLIAFANPILSAVPQIAAARNHPDPGLLKETLQDLIEAFEAGASKIGVQEEVLEGAVYALCCMADDAAASTPWGRGWTTKGLLHELRSEGSGGGGFFTLLEAIKQKPEENAELLELLYICLALGFQGQYRNAEGGAQEVDRIRADLHTIVSRRRPRPADGLSEQWRASRAGPAVVRPGVARARPAASSGLPWRAIGVTAGTAAAALLVVFIGYRATLKPEPAAVASAPPMAAAPPPPVAAAPAAPVAVAPAPEPVLTAHQRLGKELAPLVQGGLVALAEKAGRTTIGIRNDRQFASGDIQPDPAVQAILEQVGAALDRVPGRVLVRGYADGVPVKPGQFQSNVELSAARAKAAVAVIGSKMREPQRVTSEGAGEADPVAPNDTEENRAKNRRIAIVLESQS
jgi:type VI secretion system protein ImpK